MAIKTIYAIFGLLLTTILFFSWQSFSQEQINPFEDQKPETFAIPLGLPPIPWPADNPYTKKKAELGQMLYFDPRLSSDGTVSCASCHIVPRAFSDGRRLAVGIRHREGRRHSPTIINAAYQHLLFWDGRAASLEAQSKGPLANTNEMTLALIPHDAHQQCSERIQASQEYRALFKEAFGSDACSIEDIAKAIATFERTILSGNSPYDRYMAGDKTAMTPQQIEGYRIFKRSGCQNCHFGPNFSDGRFMNIGVGMDAKDPDLGRYEITGNKNDWGAFKVPTLREVAKTYPFMHDGSIATLEQVIEYYDKGGIANSNLHPLMRPLHLTTGEKEALLSFMHALSGEGWQHFSPPAKFPE